MSMLINRTLGKMAPRRIVVPGVTVTRSNYAIRPPISKRSFCGHSFGRDLNKSLFCIFGLIFVMGVAVGGGGGVGGF